MFKYQKKPIVIEAFKYEKDMGTRTAAIPRWFLDAILSGKVYEDAGFDVIKTLEGDMRIDDGDYVIQGIKGELYPCKPDIFEASYEAIYDPTVHNKVAEA